MKEQIKVGVIGCGGRGMGLMADAILPAPGVTVAAVCDLYPDRAENAAVKAEEATGFRPYHTCDADKVINDPDLDAIIVCTYWETHVNLACQAMEAGKYVGIEVGGAYSIEDCWRLVNTHEKTGVHLMMMENCCYGEYELMVQNMVDLGVFGEIIHCQGGYRHDLREEIATGKESRHYRLRNYLYRNAENYPTHEIGPIAKILGINKGNRMVTLCSMASKSAGMNVYSNEKNGPDHPLSKANWVQGDVVTTMIHCSAGQSIVITLDTTLPRAYSRGFQIQGTKAMYMEDNNSIFIDGTHNKYDFVWNKQWNNMEEYKEQYAHPLWKKFREDGVQGGHGGMDWLVFQAFFDAVKAGTRPPIDVYDAATWMAITALSEESIAKGGAPVGFPDFTRGRWIESVEV